MVAFRVKDRGFMTLGADAVTFGDQLIAVGIVAIAADNACLVHLTLYKGSIDIHLIANLPVWPVQRVLDECQSMGIQQVPAVVVIPQGTSSCMTASAVVDLGVLTFR